MITVFTFTNCDSYWAYDDETNCISGTFSSTCYNPSDIIPSINLTITKNTLQDYIKYVVAINHRFSMSDLIIVLEYSPDTNPEYFI